MRKLKPKEPKTIALVLTAATGVGLGLLLGISFLLSIPPERIAQDPDPEATSKPGDYTAHYRTGQTANAETPNMRTAISRIQRRTPGPVSFSEEELNYFFKQSKPSPQPAGADAPKDEAVFEQFNIRLVEDRMIVSGKAILNPQGDRFEMLLQAQVDFENEESGPRLVVKEMKANSMPIPSFGGLVESMLRSKVESSELPEEWTDLWSNIREIQIESGKLIAHVGLRRA